MVDVDTDIKAMSLGQQAALGGGAAAAVSVILPWVSVDLGGFGSASANGLDLNAGLLTLVLGLAIVGVILTQDWDEQMQKATMGLGGGIAALGVLTFIDPLILESGVGGANSSDLVSASFGVFVAIAGGGAAAGGGYYSYNDDSLDGSQQGGGYNQQAQYNQQGGQQGGQPGQHSQQGGQSGQQGGQSGQPSQQGGQSGQPGQQE